MDRIEDYIWENGVSSLKENIGIGPRNASIFVIFFGIWTPVTILFLNLLKWFDGNWLVSNKEVIPETIPYHLKGIKKS